IARLQQQAYHNADIVVISDFIAPRCGLEIQQQLPQLAAAGNRLHAVALSAQGNPSLLARFDSVWQRSGGVYGRLLRRQR
ncbi:MAG: ATPase RavA stimulator ViaA, partial [Plesiomonas shigelloides]